MVFSTYIFLFVFLPVTLFIYYALPFRWRALWLVLSSYVFYGWFRPGYCLLMASATLWNYSCGHFLMCAQSDSRRRLWVAVAVAGSLGLLGFYKYAGMFSEWVNTVAEMFYAAPNGTSIVPILEIALPIGISFFTFQAISYPIDLYRGDAEKAPDLLTFASYIALFPQLIAGPIVRYQWIADELRQRLHSMGKFALGMRFFILGLAKKVIIADMFALAVPAAFGPHQPNFEMAWSGVLAYSLQIYFDFSAYSDMAVGLGLMLGFTFPQNFNSPYKSASITEFWRRWHMTLSSWLRDYLYIPLGGNRQGPVRTYVNIALVMLLGGLWHGASIVFVLWGLWHGLLLVFERLLGEKHPIYRLPRPLAIALTNFLVLLGWVLFRAEDFGMAGRVLQGMFLTAPSLELQNQFVSTVVIALIPVFYAICVWMRNTWEMSPRLTLPLAVRDAVIFATAILVVMANRTTPFLYFQF